MLNSCFLISDNKVITEYKEMNIKNALKDENCFLWNPRMIRMRLS